MGHENSLSHAAIESTTSRSCTEWFELGCQLQDDLQHRDALNAFEQVLTRAPNFPTLRTKIAFSHTALRNYSTALAIYQRQTRITPNDLDAWIGLSFTAYRCRLWAQSLSAANQAFQLAPDNPSQLYTYSFILAELGHFARARQCLEQAVAAQPNNADYAVHLAFRQLEEGDYQNGWKTFEARWHWKHWKSKAWTITPVPRWTGQSLNQKNLLIWYEQWEGLGDSILFLRYLPLLAERARTENGLLLFATQNPLVTLFTRSLTHYADILSVTSLEQGYPWQWQHFIHRHPFQCSTPSLPLALSLYQPLTPTFPYLSTDPSKADAWRQILLSHSAPRANSDSPSPAAPERRRLRVGLAWTGRPDHPRNDLRSLPILDLTATLKTIPGLTLYSLQRGHSDEAHAAGLIDFTPDFTSIDDTAALISNLDLIISADCMTAHLSAALNLPTWVLVDSCPYWGWGRYLNTTPWYKSARVYRQTTIHSWPSVFQEVASDLEQLISQS